MKTLILILSIFTLFTGCAKVEEIQTENSIYGTWKLIEQFDGGSLTPIRKIENGETIIFNSQNSFSNSSIQCEGNFGINNSIIEISFPCLSNGLFKYSYSVDATELKLSDFPSTCDEGCYKKYKKIK